eukprot:1153763-Pelagomonas_calceolata.AAC.1
MTHTHIHTHRVVDLALAQSTHATQRRLPQRLPVRGVTALHIPLGGPAPGRGGGQDARQCGRGSGQPCEELQPAVWGAHQGGQSHCKSMGCKGLRGLQAGLVRNSSQLCGELIKVGKAIASPRNYKGTHTRARAHAHTHTQTHTHTYTPTHIYAGRSPARAVGHRHQWRAPCSGAFWPQWRRRRLADQDRAVFARQHVCSPGMPGGLAGPQHLGCYPQVRGDCARVAAQVSAIVRVPWHNLAVLYFAKAQWGRDAASYKYELVYDTARSSVIGCLQCGTVWASSLPVMFLAVFRVRAGQEGLSKSLFQ